MLRRKWLCRRRFEVSAKVDVTDRKVTQRAVLTTQLDERADARSRLQARSLDGTSTSRYRCGSWRLSSTDDDARTLIPIHASPWDCNMLPVCSHKASRSMP